MAHIIIDLGHSNSDSGAVANGFKEVDLNYNIGRYAGQDLIRQGHTVTYTEGTLRNRTNIENKIKPDCIVSVHNNAGGGDGTEVFYYPSSSRGKKLATCILNEVTGAKLNNSRGVKSANFHMLRETISIAALIECAFMDTKDIQAVDEEHERKAFGIAISRGILKYLGIAYKEVPKPKPPTTDKNTMYRVVTGSFSNRSNAEKRIADLKKVGFDSFIDIVKK